MARARPRLCALAAAGVAALTFGCRPATPGLPELDTPEERFSYGIGAKLGGDLRASGHAIDSALVLRGLEDGLAGESALSDEALASALADGARQRSERLQALRAEAALAAEAQGRAFLAKNRERAGVVELPSGLQYEVLREGLGPVPTLEDFVVCDYRGTLLDGAVFDDTATLGRPRSFAVTSVIDGFEEALLRMPAGSRWKLFVPPELGYGATGSGASVPPNSTLIFELELVSIGAAPSGDPPR